MRYIALLGAAFLLTACGDVGPLKLSFVDHVKAGMIEQDVYVEKVAGSGQVHRINPDEFEKFKDAQAYGTANVIHHAPFNPDANGPYEKGQDLGFTLAEWLAGSGTGTYTCRAGTGTLDVTFSKLVPNGVYTMWYAVAGKSHMGCKDCPFATVDWPMGSSDGAQSVFNADASGNAHFNQSFKSCLELSDKRLMAMLAIAYHSDGNTYGPNPGPFGRGSHVQLFTGLPDKDKAR